MKNIDRPTLILAFVLAIFLWMYVRVSQESPLESRVIYGVPVQVEGQVPGIKTSLHPDSRTVNITITGRPKAIYAVSPDRIKVKVDVSKIQKATDKPQLLPTTVTLPNTVKLEGKKPPTVTILTEDLERKSFPVTVLFIPPPEAGQEAGKYLTQPTDVLVEGTPETLERVKYVAVPVNPNEPLAGGEKIPPRAVDENGDRVDDANVLQESILVRQGSGSPRTTRKVAVRVPDFRQPRKYLVSVAKIRPDQVTLTGEPALLSKQSAFLETYPIDVSRLTKDTTMTVPLRIPAGITVAEGTTVRVDLEVQPVQR